MPGKPRGGISEGEEQRCGDVQVRHKEIMPPCTGCICICRHQPQALFAGFGRPNFRLPRKPGVERFPTRKGLVNTGRVRAGYVS